MSEANNTALVEFRDVSYAVPALPAPILSDLDLKVHRGETLVLLGESGCGKTTTLKLINRLYLPTSGEVLVEGNRRGLGPIRLRRRTGTRDPVRRLVSHFTVNPRGPGLR